MSRPGGVVDHRPAPPGMEPEAAFPQRVPEPLAILGGVPGRKGGRPDGGEGHPRPFLDEALSRREGGQRPLGVQASRRLQPVGDVAAAFLAQGPGDGAGMLGGDGRQPVLVLDDSAHFLTPGVVPGHVGDTAVATHQAVNAVFVAARMLDVLGPAIGLRPEAELSLEQSPPPRPGAGVVLDAGIGVAVDVINRLIRPASEAQGDELAHLADEIRAAEAARRDDDHAVVFRFEQVTREGIPEALAAHGAGNHLRLLRAFFGGAMFGDGGATMDGPWSPGRPDMNARAAVKRATVAASEPCASMTRRRVVSVDAAMMRTRPVMPAADRNRG